MRNMPTESCRACLALHSNVESLSASLVCKKRYCYVLLKSPCDVSGMDAIHFTAQHWSFNMKDHSVNELVSCCAKIMCSSLLTL